MKKIIALSGIALTLVGCDMYPPYRVWNAKMTGQAELARANGNRQIATLMAKQKMESARYEAQAEIIRAGGVAQANKIIGDSLKDNEAYLRYLFVNNLDHTQNQVIYIPTEAGLPILEAGHKYSGTETK